MAVAIGLTAFVAWFYTTTAAAQGEPHWTDTPPAAIQTCDQLFAGGQVAEATYCAARYQATAVGLWTESTDPEFVQALPLLAVLGVFGLGFFIGSAVYRL